MCFEFDDKDRQILNDRAANREQIEGVRLGDFVRFPTGQLERFSLSSDAHLQTSPIKAGSFYLDGDGYSSFSGGLNPPIPRDSLVLTEEKMPGEFWFFHHGEVGAHRGVRFDTPCRVYETKSDYAGFLS